MNRRCILDPFGFVVAEPPAYAQRTDALVPSPSLVKATNYAATST